MPYLPQVPTEGTESNTVLQMMCLSKKVWCLLKSDGYRFIFIDIARKFGVNHLFLDPNGHQLPWCCGSASQQLRTAGAAKAQPGFLGPARSKSYTFQFEVAKYGTLEQKMWKKCGKNVSSLRPHKQCLWKCHHIYSTKPSKNRCCPAQAPPVGFPYPYGPGLSDWEHRV